MKWFGKLLVILFAVCSAYPALAQQTLATITGVVLDSAGAAVPGAEVAVRNLNTNIEKHLTSNSTGLYEAPYLIPGHYEVAIQKEGFKRFVAADFLVQAGQIVRIDGKLEIGQVSTVVTVRDRAPAIATETSSITSFRDNRQLEEMPLNNRGSWDSFLFEFVGMTPGAQVSDASWDISFNGTRPYQNQFSVDGIATTSTLYGNIIGPANPSMEAVHEVKIDSNSNGAEFQAAGAVNVITKSGSNTLHGSGYYYYTTSGFDARDPFQTRNNRDVLQNYGASLGGPIVKNRTFFFADFENFGEYGSTPVNFAVPTAAMRQGDFSAVSTTLVNPYTGEDIAGNDISSLLNSTALKVQDYFYPQPTSSSSSYNYAASLPSDLEKYMFDVRVDHQVNTKNAFYARFDFAHMPNHSRDYTSYLPAIPKAAQVRNTRNFILSDTHTFTPTVVNEFRVGMTRGHNDFHIPISGQKVLSDLGLTGLPATIGSDIYGVPKMYVSGFESISTESATNNFEVVYQLQDSLTWQKSRHTFKFGGEVVRNHAIENFTSPTSLLGTSYFTGSFTGNAYADFLLGLPKYATTTSGGTYRGYTANYQTSLYAQDSYRITNRLTLNYGLRWDTDAPYVEKQDRSFSFNSSTGEVMVPSDQTYDYLYAGFVDAGLASVVTASEAGYPKALVHSDYSNFAPRLGFAYLLTSDQKTVLRGGYGVYFERSTDATWTSMQSGSPFNGSLSNWGNTITDGVPTWQLPEIFPTTYSTETGYDLSGINPNLKSPYIQQWNLTIEQQLSPSTGLRVSYLGTRGTKLVWIQNLNELAPSDTAYDASRRRFPNLNYVGYVDNGANSIYHGLNVTLTRKWRSGLSYESTYTWSHNISDNDNTWQGGAESGWLTYGRQYDRGNVSWSRRHRMTNLVAWELPFGNGKRFLGRGKLADKLAGGWTVTAVNLFQSGDYFTPSITTTYDMGNTNSYGGRPDCLRNANLPRGQRSISHWFDTSIGTDGAAFGYPASNRLGSCGSHTLEGPGTINVDLGLFKNLQISEKVRLQFQGTATNVMNHPNWADPDNGLAGISATAGMISSVQSYEGSGQRVIRLGLKLLW